MTALGLAANQIALATTTYGTTTPDGNGYKEGIRHPGITLEALGQRVIQDPFLCTTFPRKEGGPLPPIVTGTLFLGNSSVDGFISDARNYQTLRKLSFVDNGTEKYIWVYSGDVQSWPPLAEGGIAMLYRDVRFSFIAFRSQVYKAQDDSVLWGN
jgi:hypothetical protein